MAHIWDLPEELLANVAACLPPKDFLSLCSTCHFFYDNEDLQNSAFYWRTLLSRTFRVPNLPVAASDGRRWRSLYRRMVHQTHVMFWGKNDGGAGGLDSDGRFVHFPIDVEQLRAPSGGVIADLQCGGWSTSILTSEGEIYFSGILGHGFNDRFGATTKLDFGPLIDGKNAKFRIKQFSQGRISILGLSDAHQIWSWTSGYPAASGVRFGQHEDIKARKVVAGWQRDSALLENRGLFIWNTLPPTEHERSSINVLIDQFWNISNVKSLIPEEHLGRQRSTDPRHDEIIVNWVMLDNWIVWLTMTGRIFAARLLESYDNPLQPFEITRDDSKHLSDPSKSIVDIQGSHLSFGMFLFDGEVLIGDTAYLESFEIGQTTAGLRKIPSLQKTGVIQLAFGDWHFHALHKDGSVTSYGRELKCCGALGLGPGRMRGIKPIHTGGAWHPDGELLSQATTSGRRVIFEGERQAWLDYMGSKLGKSADRRNMTSDDQVHAEVSEWFETRLRNWDAAPPLPDDHEPAQPTVDADDDGLPAYFPVSVVAGGWHSAALVLVNKDKAARATQPFKRPAQRPAQTPAHTENRASAPGVLRRLGRLAVSATDGFLGVQPRADTTSREEWAFRDEPFPRLRLQSGVVMPGNEDEPIDEWRAPEWQEVERVTL